MKTSATVKLKQHSCHIGLNDTQHNYSAQCSKLTVHISEAGRTFFGRVRPMCAQFSLQYTRGVHRKIPGRTVSICVHPRVAQNKTLISNTELCNIEGPSDVYIRTYGRDPAVIYPRDRLSLAHGCKVRSKRVCRF